jgi:hypothetical protein
MSIERNYEISILDIECNTMDTLIYIIIKKSEITLDKITQMWFNIGEHG